MKKLLSVLLSLLMLVSAISAINLTAYANTINNAITLPFGKELSGTLSSKNQNVFYKITLPSSGKVTFYFKNYNDSNRFGLFGSGNSFLSTTLGGYSFYDQNKEKLGEKNTTYNAAQGCNYLKLTLYLLKGSYYIEEDTDKNTDFYGKYSIKADFESADEFQTETWTQQYNTLDVAQPLELNQTYKAMLADVQDSQDVYSFCVPADGAVKFTVNTENNELYYHKNIWIYNDDPIADEPFMTLDVPVKEQFNKTVELSRGKYYFILKNPQGYGNENGTFYDIRLTFSMSKSVPNNFRMTACSTGNTSLTWSRVSGVSGYQLQILKNGNWKNLGKTTATFCMADSLSAGKAYKIRVRSYLTDNNQTYFSDWNTIDIATKPKKPTLKKAVAARKHKIKTSWKAVNCTGYQIQYSKNKKFTKIISKKTVKGASKKSCLSKKMKKGKKIYVRIRAYKSVGGKSYYGAWSKAKRVKVK